MSKASRSGALLRDALRRLGKEARAIPVLNDTVASLLAGAALAPEFARPIGVIVGTGTNMAGFFPVGAIAKLARAERLARRRGDGGQSRIRRFHPARDSNPMG